MTSFHLCRGACSIFFLSGSTNQCRQSLWNVVLWLLHPTTMHEKNSNDFWFKISIICHKKKNLFFSLSLSHLWPTRLRVIYYIQQLILVQNSSPTYIHTMRRGAIYEADNHPETQCHSDMTDYLMIPSTNPAPSSSSSHSCGRMQQQSYTIVYVFLA